MSAYAVLAELAARPGLFATGGPRELWTDPYVQQQLLQAHLDPDVAAASPPHDFIVRAVEWIVGSVGVDARTRVLDLGCGPGLYANPLAEVAAQVDGIDLSATSIAAARERATSDRARFAVGDYLQDPLPEHDLALLLMYDYGAMAPRDRRGLLGRVRSRIAPGGRLLLDVHSDRRYATLEETCTIGYRLMGGFWAPGDYIGIQQTFLYDDARVALDRYVIVEPDRTWTVHTWQAHWTLDELRAELGDGGFEVVEVVGDIAGAAYDAAAPVFAVLAAPA